MHSAYQAAICRSKLGHVDFADGDASNDSWLENNDLLSGSCPRACASRQPEWKSKNRAKLPGKPSGAD